MLVNVLTAILVLVAAVIIVLVMLQQGKGADAGAAFGAGGAGSVFGASGAGNFLSRATAILATMFFILCLVLAYLGSNTAERNSVMEGALVPQTESSAPDDGSDKPASPTAGAATGKTDSDAPVSPSESSPTGGTRATE